MKKAPTPLDEELRLEDLYKYDLLDSHSEESFDELTELARDLTSSSIALISIIDKDRQWFKSKQGLEASETPRDISYCGHAIMGDELFIIENSDLDKRFCDNPLFTGPPHVTFYAGAPLIMSSGFRIGTLCVIDSKPKTLNEFQKKSLRSLAKSVVRLIELNFNNQKLLKMQRQSEDIQTLAKTGGWELDLRTNKTFWTEEVYKIHGVDHRLPFDKNDAIKFYAEHEIPRLEKIIQNAIVRKEKFDNVFEFYDANNKKKWVRSIGEPILDKDKNVIKLIGIFKDVTKEKNTQVISENINKIRSFHSYSNENKDHFYQLTLNKFINLCHSNLGFIIEKENKDNKINYNLLAYANKDLNNQQNSNVYKKVKNKFITDEMIKNMSFIFDKEKIESSNEEFPLNSELLKILDIEKISNFMIVPIKTNDQLKTIIFLANSKLIINDIDKEFISQITPLKEVIKEIVSIIKLEEKSYEENLERSFILETSQVALWKYFPQTNELHWDESMYKLYEMDPKKFSGHYDAWTSSLHEDDKLAASKDLENALKGEGKFDTLFRIKTPTKKIKYIRAKADIVFDEAGKPLKMMGVNWDFTEEKRINDQLVTAKDKAIAYSNAKSNFLANMSHEIRTPMNGVLGMISLLRETKLDPSQIEMIDTIQGCGDHLLSIINDILDFSKVESGKVEIENISFDLNQTLNEITFLLKNLTTVKNINFETKFHNDLPAFIIGDVGKIKQIIMNLISNASKFTEKGSISLEVCTVKNDGKNIELQFKIKDTGIGISDENQLKLFNAFTQADSSTTRKFGGTGLGLSICKKLVNAMNGTIQLNSQINIGTEVIVNLPFEISSQLEAEKSLEKAPTFKIDINFSENFPHNILVAEDNKINQKLIHMMLKKLGYQIDFANNGKEAVDMAVSNEYSLIFMDMQMPELDGIEATKIILERQNQKNPKIIAITANAMIEDKAKCLQAGMIDFLTKPIKLNDLRKIISKIG